MSRLFSFVLAVVSITRKSSLGTLAVVLQEEEKKLKEILVEKLSCVI